MNRWTNHYYDQNNIAVTPEVPGGGKGGGIGVSRHQRHQVPDVAASATSARTRRSHSSYLRSGIKVAELWVFRVVHLTEVTLKSFIERQGIEVLDIEQVSHKEAAYKSFMVTVEKKDAAQLLHRTYWPGLVSCKLWSESGEGRRTAILSRRAARTVPHTKQGSKLSMTHAFI